MASSADNGSNFAPFPLSRLEAPTGVIARVIGVPLPASLPGEFFVLIYDRDNSVYTLFVDDAEESSYKLGNLETSRLRFNVWGMKDFGDRCLDQAREFKTVQGIWSQDRILNLIERTIKSDVFARDDQDSQTYASLPSL